MGAAQGGEGEENLKSAKRQAAVTNFDISLLLLILENRD
jgi:hypothetical protein